MRWTALQLRYAPKVTVNSFDAVCRMVEAGLGISVIPQSAGAGYAGAPRFVLRPLAEPWAARTLMLLALRRSPQPRAVQALIDSLRG